MSITLVPNESTPAFGENNGVWKYFTIDGILLCYVVRKEREGKKYFIPWTKQNGEWVSKWLKNELEESLPKPIYNIQSLNRKPTKPVLIVEGEKTADAGIELFPGFNVISWMGGAGGAKHVDWTPLKGQVVYLLPDNDESGYKAMEYIKNSIMNYATELFFVDIAKLGVEKGWDIADIEHGNIDFQDVKSFVINTRPIKLIDFDLYSYPDLSNSEKPRPLDTTANLKHLLTYFNIKIRWNLMNRSREVIVPDKDFYYEERENIALTHITNIAVIHQMNIRRIDKHLDFIASEDCYHPICDWILSAPLKEKGIFNKFLTCLKTTNDTLSRILIKRWMVSAVTAAFSTGDFAPQGVLVIHGAQYTHKSSFIMSLAPKELRAVKGGLILDPSKKDDVLTASQYWIAELAELDATFKKTDSNRLKGFINLDEDSIRKPYAMKDSKLVRRTVFAATVNESKFLIDTTGNRRWWTISITEPINTYHGFDMQQVWREAYEMYLDGESPNLSKEELILLNGDNQEYEFLDPFKEKFDNVFYWDREPCQWMNASQVLSEIGYDKPSSGDLKRMGDILTKMNLSKGTGRKRYSYYVPQVKPRGFQEM